jgi:hypothetical protein
MKNNQETSVERDDQPTTNTEKLAYTEALERLAHARTSLRALRGFDYGGATDGSQQLVGIRRKKNTRDTVFREWNE